MTATRAADRLDDSYPHGTPRGYRDGCRGSGGCPHRGTDRMTCPEAFQRYASDHTYRRAYDHGDIWLDRATRLDPAIEKARDAAARRAMHHRGLPTDQKATPRPASAPAASEEPAGASTAAATLPDAVASLEAAAPTVKPPRKNAWQHGTVVGYDKHKCRCDACTTAKREKNARARGRTRARLAGACTGDDAVALASRRITELEQTLATTEQTLATTEQARIRAEALAAFASRERAAAVDQLDRVVAQRLTAETAAAARPAPRPIREEGVTAIRIDTTDGGLLFTLSAFLTPDTIQALAEHVKAAS